MTVIFVSYGGVMAQLVSATVRFVTHFSLGLESWLEPYSRDFERWQMIYLTVQKTLKNSFIFC